MRDGDVAEALKLLDVVGTSPSDSALLHLALSLQLDQSPDVTKVLKSIIRLWRRRKCTNSVSLEYCELPRCSVRTISKSRQVNGKVPHDGGQFEKDE